MLMDEEMSQASKSENTVLVNDCPKIMPTLRENSESRDWRVAAIIIIVLYVSFLVGLSGLTGIPTKSFLHVVGIPALDHPLMDLRGVAVWCEMFLHGGSPMLHQGVIDFPGEQQYQTYVMNYSPVVLGMGWLGLLPVHVIAWGVGLIILYGVSLWYLAGFCTLRNSLLWTLLICSPCSGLVVERGNLDMLVFALLIGGVACRALPIFESFFLILTAAALKFFPAPAFLAVWQEGSRKSRIVASLGVMIFLVLLWIIRSHLAAIGGSLSGSWQSSFGSVVIVDLLHHYGALSDQSLGLGRTVLKVVGIIFCLTLFLAGFLGRSKSGFSISEKAYHAFFMGAPIIILLFTLGNNMDYKWIFLLLQVPALLMIQTSKESFEATISRCWIVLLLIYSYWTFFSDEGSLRNAILKQAVMWFVIGITAFMTGRLWERKLAI